jgi:tRNA-dihydrouridine synthase B
LHLDAGFAKSDSSIDLYMTISEDFFRQPFQLGGLTIPNRALLSPLAGVSDVPFRRICRELGAGLTYVEMLSSVAINRETARTADMLRRHADETILGVQLTGPNPECVAEAAGRLEKEGFDTIDINMGCPVRKIVKKGWGSAILKEPERVYETVKRCSETVSVPVSAKLRIGYTHHDINAIENGRRVVEGGANMVMFHGRTRSDDYGAPINYAAIKEGLSAAVGTEIATVGNGNVMDRASAEHMVEATDCDAVLVSRGALGNPWIFRQILEPGSGHPTVREWREVVLRHLDYIRECYGDDLINAIRFRKHLLWYVSGFPQSKKMRPILVAVNTLE